MIEVDVSGLRGELLAGLVDCAMDPRRQLTLFLGEARRRAGLWPVALTEAVADFASDRDSDGVLIVRGLPVDPVLPPTPTRAGGEVEKQTRVSELCLCAVATALGHPVGYRDERAGAVLHDVYPTPANAAQLSSDSSKSTLGLHTEMAFHSLLPDYVVLMGLRQDPEREAVTTFAGVRRILPRISARAKEVLHTTPVAMEIEYSYAPQARDRAAPLRSVLYGDPADPFFRFDGDLLTAPTPLAQGALDEVAAAAEVVHGSVRLEPGVLVALDNRRAVHGRSSFAARYDGGDRWLQRTVVRKELPSSADREGDPRIITRFL